VSPLSQMLTREWQLELDKVIHIYSLQLSKCTNNWLHNSD